jgi:hypothetical protein
VVGGIVGPDRRPVTPFGLASESGEAKRRTGLRLRLRLSLNDLHQDSTERSQVFCDVEKSYADGVGTLKDVRPSVWLTMMGEPLRATLDQRSPSHFKPSIR